jgi:hypothetical protein
LQRLVNLGCSVRDAADIGFERSLGVVADNRRALRPLVREVVDVPLDLINFFLLQTVPDRVSLIALKLKPLLFDFSVQDRKLDPAMILLRRGKLVGGA